MVFADTSLSISTTPTSPAPRFTGGKNSSHRRKVDSRSVNIFHKRYHYITISFSKYCKSYCFTFQKRRFCMVKAALLHRKTAAFAMPNRNYHFSYELSLQNKGDFLIKSVLYSLRICGRVVGAEFIPFLLPRNIFSVFIPCYSRY